MQLLVEKEGADVNYRMLKHGFFSTTVFLSTMQARPASTSLVPLVLNNAEAAKVDPALGYFRREGYTSPGDGGGAEYTTSSKPCSLNGGGGDGGSQIAIAKGGCAIISWASVGNAASVLIWGAKDDDSTDNQTAFTKAWQAVAAIGGGEVVIPATAGCFRLNRSVVVAGAGVNIRGQRGGSCLDRGFASGHVLQFGNLTATYSNLGAYDLSFKHSVIATGAGSADIEFMNAPNSHAERIRCSAGAYFCTSFDASGPYWLRDLFASADGQAAIAAGCNGYEPADIHIDGADIAYQHRAGLEFCNVGGVTISHVNTDFNTHAIWAHPSAGQQVSAVYSTDSYFDYSSQEGILADGSAGTISEWALSDTTWIASCGAAPPASFIKNLSISLTINPKADCLYIAASSPTSTLVTDNRWMQHIFAAGGNGIAFFGGINNEFGNLSTQNCQNNALSTCSGLNVAASVSHWSWNGNAGPITNLGLIEKQKYGVYVSTGSSDYYTVHGDLSGNVIAAVFDGGTGTHKSFTDVVPGVPWSAFHAIYGSLRGNFGSSPIGIFSYSLSGSTVNFSATVSIGLKGSAAGSLTISLPLQALTVATVLARNQGTGEALLGVINAGESKIDIRTFNGGIPGLDNTTIVLSGSYQATHFK